MFAMLNTDFKTRARWAAINMEENQVPGMI